MNVSADQAKVTARAFAAARHRAWDENDVVVSTREANGKIYWAVTTIEAGPSVTTWETPLDTPSVDYLVDRESGHCVGIATPRLIHWLPKSWQVGDSS